MDPGRHLPRPGRVPRLHRPRLARHPDPELQQDPGHRGPHQLDHRDPYRRGQPGRDRPQPDRPARRVRTRPERALHGRGREGHHQLPGQHVLLRGRPGARRAGRAGERERVQLALTSGAERP
ncbi:hypothetical protein SCOCK_180101 [Actinacidiphila cocklensis]|uniref:Uncharacterized protein n=1 Tax=Actinacidiphila cocklensis TaxID=887465 RepID=A0A9W4DM70_9ACTN|nr:hypothetical protein SCOCK_180101 [Actinacidiphila cocklensis]